MAVDEFKELNEILKNEPCSLCGKQSKHYTLVIYESGISRTELKVCYTCAASTAGRNKMNKIEDEKRAELEIKKQ